MTAWRLERLDPQHDREPFRSGNDTLDSRFADHALAAQQMDSARTFVLADGTPIAGYFSLTMASVRRLDAPRKLVRGLPAYPVGAVLIARLAVRTDLQGQGLGALLLAESLRRAVTAGEAVAARLVVIDAVDDTAVRFSEHYGFLAVPEHLRRLSRRMKDVCASLEE